MPSFCNCAAPSPHGDAPPPTARVCPSCGLGLLLETRRDVLPSSHDAFLVIDSALLVQAVSRRAQALLGVTEEGAVDRPVAELLAPADAEAQGRAGFAAALADAAAGADEPANAIVRPWNTFGVRMRARIAAGFGWARKPNLSAAGNSVSIARPSLPARFSSSGR